MKSLCLREWTLEVVNSKPVLLLRAKNNPRGSVEIDEIKSVKLINPDTGEVEIHTAYSVMNGQPLPYTTRNVEQWPPLDPHVFHMFGINPLWLPEDHEYQSWHVENAKPLNVQPPRVYTPAEVSELVRPAESRQPKPKLFVKTMHGTIFNAVDWVNDHQLAEEVISIYPSGPAHMVILYRSAKEIE